MILYSKTVPAREDYQKFVARVRSQVNETDLIKIEEDDIQKSKYSY